MSTSAAADNLRIKHEIDDVEPPISVLARGLLNKNNEVVLDLANAETPAEVLAILGARPAGGMTASEITDAGAAFPAFAQAETAGEQRTLIGAEYPTILLPSGKNILGNIPNDWANSSIDTALVLGNSVTSIGNNAFNYCSGLTGALTIGNSVTSIGSYAFNYCSGLTGSLTIGNSVTTIGSYAFNNCSGLTSLTIGDSVTTIGNGAFYNCSGLTGALTIPNSVTSIGSNAFYNCSGLTGSLTIPNSVTTIGNTAFSNCSSLTGSLTIGNSVTTIGSTAFSNCSSLTGSLTIPNSVTTIGNNAFYNCSGLTNVNCRMTKAAFDATDGAANMFTGTSASLVLHALPATGWTAGTGLSIGGNSSVDVVLDLT